MRAGVGTRGAATFSPARLYGVRNRLHPDGRFPIHHPDPTVPENLELLIDKVKHEKADLGIAYDGDADRIGAVDEQGNILWGDELWCYSRGTF